MLLSSRLAVRAATTATRKFSTKAPIVPRILDRVGNETGPGGRGSDADVKVAVFGATGFLGRYVCCNLGTNGYMTTMGNRGDDMEVRFLKPMFELGRSKFEFYSPRDRDSMAEVIGDADIVINMIGKYYETKALSNIEKFPYLEYKTNFTYKETNVDIARTIAELCTEMQVDNLIHVSSMAATPDTTSEWAKSKYEGELAVKEAYPWATIIRPTQLFGPEDRFLNWFANAANMYPVVPLIDGGHALTQPVYMADVAAVIEKVVDNPEQFEGRQIDCFGSNDFSYKELAQFVYDITGQEPSLFDTPKSVALSVAKLLQYQGRPMITPSLVELWNQDYIPPMTQEEYDAEPESENKVYTMKDLGIEATLIEKIAFSYMHRFREGGHFILAKGYH
uniref:NAD-dependent epimerase/dehydratase domain-containing protein n=1 Tax=Eucampia antarctica TaxID=49252 RepID=A0A7S2VZI2_9STRA|mmetsp:Transcript_13536/g.13112  ORF Transcript_13536/g.13112 Transcript_13536/m.13112 type:complete len:392 (+) Transcript_13536:48-1223(+)|eukprot:CAMPEP_0197832410 /NCGR_PEP_ID=MMETSP1437-20131217/14642_1 /TAXON_ID=49252 ORGANISM="Eucampia antarctica, Strain CCMP1452" /NCGR_SAMPLE_ID=MMETSP1437 /ASSEMBLY_ACC=CAM_ASM_001096 /LENGTH=391 /DNA_ID=CAMNT_0043435783 /DNA_START=44 /DNA_END=1219 /DNA_ORIENTATION=+